jgi:hypothetical protein
MVKRRYPLLMKFLEFLKLSWMLAWRVFLWCSMFMADWAGWLLSSTVVIAFVTTMFFNRSMKTFPIIRFFINKTIVFDPRYKQNKTPLGSGYTSRPRSRQGDYSRIPPTYTPRPKVSPHSTPHPVYVDDGHKPAVSSVKTPYDNKALDRVELDLTAYQWMRGTPGVGLDAALTAGKMTASAVSAGQAGEELLAKALSITDVNGGVVTAESSNQSILDSVRSYWSVAMPHPHYPHMKDPEMEADIDCILVTANTIILLDAKLYRGGNIIYRNGVAEQLVTYDKDTGKPFGRPYSMSRNMVLAHKRIAELYPKMKVRAMVVLTTPYTGEASVEASWVGGIPLFNMTQAMTVVANIVGSEAGCGDQVLDRNMSALLK